MLLCSSFGSEPEFPLSSLTAELDGPESGCVYIGLFVEVADKGLVNTIVAFEVGKRELATVVFVFDAVEVDDFVVILDDDGKVALLAPVDICDEGDVNELLELDFLVSIGMAAAIGRIVDELITELDLAAEVTIRGTVEDLIAELGFVVIGSTITLVVVDCNKEVELLKGNSNEEVVDIALVDVLVTAFIPFVVVVASLVTIELVYP
jgi:hypothetical protein